MNIIEYSSDLYVGLYTILRDTYDSKISKEDLENNYLCHDKMIFLALIDNTVVGCAFLEVKRDYVRTYKYGYISYVAVDEKYRQHGIGRALIERLMSKSLREVWYIDSVEMNLSCLSLGIDMTLLRSI